MPLSTKELAQLLRLVGQTLAEEIDCDACLTRVAQFAESRLAGRPLDEGLRAVAQHLAVCGECQEEYLALQRALEQMPRE